MSLVTKNFVTMDTQCRPHHNSYAHRIYDARSVIGSDLRHPFDARVGRLTHPCQSIGDARACKIRATPPASTP